MRMPRERMADAPESAEVWSTLNPQEQDMLRDLGIIVAPGETVQHAPNNWVYGYYAPVRHGDPTVVVSTLEHPLKTIGSVAHEIGHSVDNAYGKAATPHFISPSVARNRWLSDSTEFGDALGLDLDEIKRLGKRLEGTRAEEYMEFMRYGYERIQWNAEIFADVWAASHGFWARGQLFAPDTLKVLFPNVAAFMAKKGIIPAKWLRRAAVSIPGTPTPGMIKNAKYFASTRGGSGTLVLQDVDEAKAYADALIAQGYSVDASQISKDGEWLLSWVDQSGSVPQQLSLFSAAGAK